MILNPLISTLFPYTTLFRSALGMGIEFLETCGIEVKPGIALDLEKVVGRKVDAYVQRGEYKGRGNNQVVSSTLDRKSTRLNSSHRTISYAVFCLKKKKKNKK